MKDLILPHALMPGATIGICSPSGPVLSEKLEAAVRAIKARGYRVRLSENVFARHGFLAGDDDTRLAELQGMFQLPDVDAVFASRGGHGMGRILSRLFCEKISASRKCFVSFSDLTAFSWLLFGCDGFVTFSGPLAVEWGGGVAEEELDKTLRLLSGDGSLDLLDGVPRENLKVLKDGTCEGTLLPGNLTMIASLLGTPFLPDISGAVLVLEEVGEARYRLDRLLFHLRNAGIFRRVGALLIGDMLHSAPDEKDMPSVDEIVLDATKDYDFPILSGIPYGHGAQRLTLPVGVPVKLNTSALDLQFLGPVVERAA
ncbi:LD-carboxypeptidase [bacterium]|nr:LD-carboxypeptidase [bacterium]